jgi:ATP phosphoribosyltransferase regulatory subunit HisZ
MGIFDSVLSQLGGHADVGNLASKLGIPSEVAEKAIAALGQSHAEPGDTIQGAAAKTGLDSGVLSQIVEQIGGEGSLGQYAQTLQDNPMAKSVLGMLDRDGDGNPLNDIAGIAAGLFGKK